MRLVCLNILRSLMPSELYLHHVLHHQALPLRQGREGIKDGLLALRLSSVYSASPARLYTALLKMAFKALLSVVSIVAALQGASGRRLLAVNIWSVF